MLFEELDIIAPILRALKEENYTEPTPIQAQSIPLVLNRNDVLGSAQTGTGKTAAFSIPILQQLYEDKQDTGKIKALIVTPTRELAIQIGESLNTYGRYTRLKNAVIFGGVSQTAQKAELRKGVDILVATPGRLLDLMEQNVIHLNHIRHFVLDEADRMLDMGFIRDIQKIIEKLPKKRQSLFFSATMPQNIVDLSRKILHNPQKVAVNPVSSTARTITQYLYYTNKSTKLDLLLHILNEEDLHQVLIFARTKHGADKITRNLKKKNISSAAIHGNKAQNQRQRALTDFKDGSLRILVATDIAARGIDIDKLKYVINYDIPNVAETYVHRIGRSGRAGEAGMAISLCEPEENVYIKDIEQLTKQNLKEVTDNPFPQSDTPMNEQEKKAVAKEKQRKKQEFFANRKKNESKPHSSKSDKRRRR